MKRKWDVSNEKTREKCIDEIVARVVEQEGLRFGVIAAEDIIEIVLQNVGPDIYNLALRDAKKKIEEKLADLEVDLDLLKHEG